MNDFLKALVFGGIFLIPFLPIYVENDFFFPFITGKNFAFRIIIEVIFAAWILLMLLDQKYRPRFSWMIAAFGSLLVVMFFANLFGEYPLKSFWSNFERMDGYVSLLHLFAMVVVMGSVMTKEKLWTYFFYVSTAVALFVALYGLAQFSGVIEGGRARIDSRLGNASYMAVYMLFHIFFVVWLAVRSKNYLTWIIGTLIVAIFAYTLLFTGTRGTFLGFGGGAALAIGYIALFGRTYPELRRYAVGGVIAMVLLAGGFIAVKDTDTIQNIGPLARIANIDIMHDLQVRSVIWFMALDGVAERPLLGWGQGNFNYVFNKEFEPELWNREAWFDRVHNIVLDWLIAGGVLGFLAYVSIFLALMYYLVWLPLVRNDERIDVLERAVIIGLIAGYVMHNLVVFDNIISYIFFGCVLALVHFRVSEKIEVVEDLKVDNRIVTQVAAPLVLVVTVAVVYFANMPGIMAAGDIIDAMRSGTVQERLEEFHNALSHKSFADQEIVEQLAQQAMAIARNPNLPEDQRQMMVQRAELELLRMVEEKPGDARLHNFLATFYRNIGAVPQAREQSAIARSLSPQKPAIILEQGIVEVQANDIAAARDFFKEAYELATNNTQALILYAATEVQLGNIATARELIGEEHFDDFATNEYALSSANQSGELEFLAELFERRVELAPQRVQDWASLAYVYYEMDDLEQSIATLREAASTAPAFAVQAECFIDNIRAGNEPAEGCSQSGQ